MDTQLKGRVAFVTGASQGIGEAIARALHGDGAKLMNFMTSAVCVDIDFPLIPPVRKARRKTYWWQPFRMSQS